MSIELFPLSISFCSETTSFLQNCEKERMRESERDVESENKNGAKWIDKVLIFDRILVLIQQTEAMRIKMVKKSYESS